MTADTDRRRILEMVAQGRISAQEAAELLASVGKAAPPPEEEGRPQVEKVRVIGTFRALEISGDPSLVGAVAEGLHRVRTENGTLVFEEEPFQEGEPDFVLFGPGRRGKRINVRINDRQFSIGDPQKIRALRIRMNPDLPLEVEMTAGSARVRGVRSPITASLTAGSGRFEGIRSPIKLNVDAGSLRVEGLFDRGDSEIRCTAGRVSVELDPKSSVRITARATLGKISLPGGEEWKGMGGGKREATIGDGKATLDIEATTGKVDVEVES